MRFTYIDAMIDPSFYVPLAQAAEEAGFDSFAVPDSICFPEESDSQYPYNPDGDREFLREKPFIEPFSLIPVLAASTSRMRFNTFVLKLPMRHPVLAAKQASSVAFLSGNRFDFGVGISPWPEDYEVVGLPWARRGKRFDEMLDIVQGLTDPAGEFFSYEGEFYDVPSMQVRPVPTEPIPLLFGGHSEPALKRAARRGDGWMHAGGLGGDDLGQLLDRLHELRREQERDHLPFSVHAISMDAYTPEGIELMEQQGITDAIVGFRYSYAPGPDPETLDEKITNLQRYAETVIAKTR
jgi:probable F420-dependent oxidoreductase